MLWHWSTDVKKFKKENSKAFRLWRLEQILNFGLGKGKISKKEIKKHWPQLKERVDPEAKRLVEFFLWGKQYSLPARKFFWER